MRAGALLALAGWTLLCAACAGDGDEPVRRGSVEGRVTDTRGEAVAGARVDAASLDTPAKAVPELAVLTGPDGEYEWSLQAGRYDLTVVADGFRPASKEIGIEPGVAAELDFTVEPLP
jgi:hypothetical protein